MGKHVVSGFLKEVQKELEKPVVQLVPSLRKRLYEQVSVWEPAVPPLVNAEMMTTPNFLLRSEWFAIEEERRREVYNDLSTSGEKIFESIPAFSFA